MKKYNDLPNTAESFFANEEINYIHKFTESKDEQKALCWFIENSKLYEYLLLKENNMAIFYHPVYEKILGLQVIPFADFCKYEFKVWLYDEATIGDLEQFKNEIKNNCNI